MELFDNTTFKDLPFLTEVTVKDGKIANIVSNQNEGLALYNFPNKSSYCKKIEELYQYKEECLVGAMWTKKNLKESELPLRYGYPDFERLFWQENEMNGEACGQGFPFVFRSVLSRVLDKLKIKGKEKARYGLLGYSYAFIKEQEEAAEYHSWIITLKLVKRDKQTDEPIGEPFFNIGVITDVFNGGSVFQAELGAPRISIVIPRRREDLDWDLPLKERKKYKK